MSNNQPVHTLRDGAIKATVWANRSEKGTFYSVIVVRGYKDQTDNWKDTDSFSGGDILKASNLYQSAYNFILSLIALEKQDSDQNTPESA